MTSAIERLPVEVFDLITPHLELHAYHAVRLSSCRLRLLSFSSFSKRFFSDVTTSLGSASLSRLVNVSNHVFLSKAVNVLDIKILSDREYTLLTEISRVGIYPPPMRFPKISGIKPADISEECSLYNQVISKEFPKYLVDRLVRVLRGFPNLKVVCFRTHNRELLSWHLAAEPSDEQTFRSRCFKAVFNAILTSGIQLEEFSMAKKWKRAATPSMGIHLPHSSLQLPFSSLPAVRHCFAQSQCLTLSIAAAYNGDSRVPGWEHGLSNLIACAPGLKMLILSLDRLVYVSHYSAAVVQSLASSCRLEELDTFHLLNCKAHESDLIRLLRAHKDTLQFIVLSNIKLLTGNWPSLWTSLLDMEKLKYVRLASLDSTTCRVFFQRKRERDKYRITLDTEKSGRSMRDLLDDLITSSNTETDFYHF